MRKQAVSLVRQGGKIWISVVVASLDEIRPVKELLDLERLSQLLTPEEVQELEKKVMHSMEQAMADQVVMI